MSNEVKGSEYDFKKIDALSQFHIVRRAAPVVSELLGALTSLDLKGKKADEISFDDIDFESVAKNLGPVSEALAKLPDEDVNYILFNLLKGVSRKQVGGGFAPVMAPGSKDVVMFEDIKTDLVLMLTLAGKSAAANLGGFINALPSGLKEGARQSQQIG